MSSTASPPAAQRREDFFVEPHAQVTWWGLDYDDLNMNGKVEFLGKDNIPTRLGLRASLALEGASVFAPYAEINWVHNSETYGSRWGGYEDNREGTDNLAELKFGTTVQFTDGLSGYGNISLNLGDAYDRGAGEVGLKYIW